MLDLKKIFEDNDDEYLKGDRVDPSRRLHPRPDIDAFLRLHNLVPDDKDMVCGAEHDEFYLETPLDYLAEKATEQDIIDLIRCGVRLGEYGLCMFA